MKYASDQAHTGYKSNMKRFQFWFSNVYTRSHGRDCSSTPVQAGAIAARLENQTQASGIDGPEDFW